MSDLDITWVTGGHSAWTSSMERTWSVFPAAFLWTCRWYWEAERRGIPLSNDSQIFLEEAPCPVIGITGSAGKSTTTALVGEIARLHFAMRKPNNRAWVGGNIGNPLINHVDQMQEGDMAIMELSSFQLEIMTLSPDIAVILNLTPNHLDRHKTMSAYVICQGAHPDPSEAG